MPSGGARPGAGRPKGSKTSKIRPRFTQADLAKAAMERGISPLEYLLDLMRDETVPAARRDWAAEKAAQYCHPRLAMVAHNTTPARTVNNVQVTFVVPEGHDLGDTIDNNDVIRIGPPQ